MNKTNKDSSTQCNTYLESLSKLKTTATECKVASKTTSTQTNGVKFEVTTASLQMKLFILLVFVMAADALDSCYTNQERKNIEQLQNHIPAFTKSVDTLKTGLKGEYYLRTFTIFIRFCKKEDSSLVNVKDIDENKWLQSQFKDVDKFWLGITDGNLKHWINAFDYAPTTYFNWYPIELGNVGENCAMFITNTGKWADYPCGTRTHMFVCKKDVR
ncbi:MRC [Mytilus coruscus]|uniref:MRC n=1 Tax=Mytilus coruscus TaxID=42192 RepID=A0A6J8C7Y4_MYTCO|nr:MRC [Mytilus coruscus]